MNDTTQKLMFSSATEEWSTPQEFFNKLNQEFDFELDPAATAENTKCPRFFSKDSDGLQQSWCEYTTFVNPPYGRGVTGKWVEKAHDEWERGGTVVMLLPARTDTVWFHKWIVGKAIVRFVKGRLKFGGSLNPAPFPSMVVIFHPDWRPESSSAYEAPYSNPKYADYPTPKLAPMTEEQKREFVKHLDTGTYALMPITTCRHCGGEL